MRRCVPKVCRSHDITVGTAKIRTRTGTRASSITLVIIRQLSARSKPSGRTTGTSVTSTDVIRSMRKVRWPASVSATRYQRLALVARPSGCTTRVLIARSRAT